MNQRATLTIQILEKLGAPALAAIDSVAARQAYRAPGAPAAEPLPVTAYAEKTAELLGKSVQAGVSLSKSLDLQGLSGPQGEALNLAVTAVAASLIAGHYRHTEKMPDDNDLRRLLGALEAAISFGDNFAATPENEQRLAAVSMDVQATDEDQIHIQHINAMVPVINAVAAFSFGEPEKKLVQDIAVRLAETAAGLRAALAPEAQAVKRAELALLRGLALIYVDCHEAEKTRLMALDEAARTQALAAVSLTPVWAAFDTRVAILHMIGETLSGGHAVAPAAASAPAAVSAPAAQAAPAAANPSPFASFVKQPAQDAPPPAQPVAAAPAPVTPPVQAPAAAEGGAYNPMSFFKPGTKKPDDGTSTEEGG